MEAAIFLILEVDTISRIGVRIVYGKRPTAPSVDTKARSALITGWLELHSDSEIYHCVSTDSLLQKCFLAHGFHKTPNKQWFFVHSLIQNDIHPEKNWFIMSGDSDGEFLEAAATGFE